MINEMWVKRYCSEDISLIENYEQAINDTTQTWHCHHKLEIELNKTPTELNQLGLYYGVKASDLIFLTKTEHIHMHNQGKKLSKEHKLKIGDSLKGKFKNRILTDEWRKKISNSLKGKLIGKPCPTKGKKKVWNDESHTKFHFE